MVGINAGEYIATGIGLSAKLRKDRKKEVAAVLLIFIAKIAIEISHGCRSFLALSHNIFDYPGAAII
jgi:hypothetical protein